MTVLIYAEIYHDKELMSILRSMCRLMQYRVRLTEGRTFFNRITFVGLRSEKRQFEVLVLIFTKFGDELLSESFSSCLQLVKLFELPKFSQFNFD